MWKRIDESNYEISKTGLIRNIKNKKIVKSFLNKNGYACISIPINQKGKRERWKVHRLMAKVFLNNFSKDLEVHHINGIRNDNRLENLECVTHLKNVQYIKIDREIKNKEIIEKIIKLYNLGKTIDEINFFFRREKLSL